MVERDVQDRTSISFKRSTFAPKQIRGARSTPTYGSSGDLKRRKLLESIGIKERGKTRGSRSPAVNLSQAPNRLLIHQRKGKRRGIRKPVSCCGPFSDSKRVSDQCPSSSSVGAFKEQQKGTFRCQESPKATTCNGSTTWQPRKSSADLPACQFSRA